MTYVVVEITRLTVPLFTTMPCMYLFAYANGLFSLYGCHNNQNNFISRSTADLQSPKCRLRRNPDTDSLDPRILFPNGCSRIKHFLKLIENAFVRRVKVHVNFFTHHLFSPFLRGLLGKLELKVTSTNNSIHRSKWSFTTLACTTVLSLVVKAFKSPPTTSNRFRT